VEKMSWTAKEEMEQLSNFRFEGSIKGAFKKARILVDGLEYRYHLFSILLSKII
jgi:hypothetical protein